MCLKKWTMCITARFVRLSVHQSVNQWPCFLIRQSVQKLAYQPDSPAVSQLANSLTVGLLRLLWQQMSVNSISNTLWITFTHAHIHKHVCTLQLIAGRNNRISQKLTHTEKHKHAFPLLLRFLASIILFPWLRATLRSHYYQAEPWTIST